MDCWLTSRLKHFFFQKLLPILCSKLHPTEINFAWCREKIKNIMTTLDFKSVFAMSMRDMEYNTIDNKID